MIEDIKSVGFSLPKDFHILTSTHRNLQAMTGWKIVQFLIDQIFLTDKCSNPEEICDYLEENLATPLEGQKANVMINKANR